MFSLVMVDEEYNRRYELRQTIAHKGFPTFRVVAEFMPCDRVLGEICVAALNGGVR